MPTHANAALGGGAADSDRLAGEIGREDSPRHDEKQAGGSLDAVGGEAHLRVVEVAFEGRP